MTRNSINTTEKAGSVTRAGFLPAMMLLFLFLLYGVSCTPGKKLETTAVSSDFNALRFIGEYDVPYNLPFKETTVGGLSGIDYDPASQLYYFISDDRSAVNPARFYTARIFFNAKGIDSMRFADVINMLQPDGHVYPNNKQDPFHVPDPEAMRYNPVTRQLIWSSEGERIVNARDTILENPAITVISPDGKYIDSFHLPPQLYMHASENGPRQNSVLEGLTFTEQYKYLYVSLEEPLYDDGPRADTLENRDYTRIFKFDIAQKKCIAQYAYKLEKVAHTSIPPSGFKINGIPDILSIGNDKFIVIERSFSTGHMACTIRVFIADLGKASDINDIPSLKSNTSFTPASKKLLINMDDLGIYIDNIEGVTWGPLLPNGHRTLLFIADNNFSIVEKSQLLLFEVMD